MSREIILTGISGQIDRTKAGVQVVIQHAPYQLAVSAARRHGQELWVRARLLEQGCITHHLGVTDVRAAGTLTCWSFQVPNTIEK